MKKLLLALFAANALQAATLGTICAPQDITTGKTVHITVKPGDDFKIELAEIPSASFSWTVTSYDASKLTLVSNQDIPVSCAACPPTTGGNFTKVFTFEAIKKGKSTIVITSTNSPIQTIVIKVKAESSCFSCC